MFGKNEIIGQKYFNDVKDNQLFVTSMFFTLQGEGVYAGKPALFIRLAKCNLACSFCDTFFDDGDWMTFDQVEMKIEQTIDDHFAKQKIDRPDWTRHGPLISYKKKMVLVITGGEPTLQKNIGPFLNKMKDIFQHTQIETNGIVFQPSIPLETTLVVSPKCLEKDGKPVRYTKPNQQVLDRAKCLKFVVTADKDSPYHTIPEWAFQWTNRGSKPIFISPMNVYNDQPKKSKLLRQSGVNRIDIDQRSTVDEIISFWEPGLLNMQANQRNHEYAAEYCVNNGFTMNLQMHLYASLA